MKKLKTIVALFTAAMLCLLPIFSNTLTVQAEENPITYYVKQVGDEFRFQYGAWNDSDNGRELYYLTENIKNGDHLVIDIPGQSIDLKVNASLNSLTVVNSSLAIIGANAIDTVYIINNSTASITGDVNNAYVYHHGVGNFNSNVSNLYVVNTADHDNPDATIAAVGTVGHVKATDGTGTYYEYYNFKANTLRIDGGNLVTASENFSKTPAAAPTTPATPAAPTTGTTSSGAYDDVPKTADTFVNPLWFLGIAVVCLAGRYSLKSR